MIKHEPLHILCTANKCNVKAACRRYTQDRSEAAHTMITPADNATAGPTDYYSGCSGYVCNGGG